MQDRLQSFGGTSNENPQDFLRGFLREIGPAKDSKKIEQFENYLLSNSDADDWFSNLPDTDKDTWPNLKAAFNKRYPKPVRIKKTASQYEDELLAIVLKEEKLGLKVQRHGVEAWSHIAWVEDLLAIAKLANIASVRSTSPQFARTCRTSSAKRSALTTPTGDVFATACETSTWTSLQKEYIARDASRRNAKNSTNDFAAWKRHPLQRLLELGRRTHLSLELLLFTPPLLVMSTVYLVAAHNQTRFISIRLELRYPSTASLLYTKYARINSIQSCHPHRALR